MTSFSLLRLLGTTIVLILLQVNSVVADNFNLPPLPYDYDALEPHLSSQTLKIHHGKHHAKYVSSLNAAIGELADLWQKATLENILIMSKGLNTGLFNNAAQSWNHEFYWNCMTPSYKDIDATSSLYKQIVTDFGSFENFKSEFATAGNTAFGSGWAWLVVDKSPDALKKLFVTKAIGADNPMAQDPMSSADKDKVHIPILTVDVWEHAYYLDYQNLRPKYVETFLNNLVNWQFVSDNFDRANGGKGKEGEGEL